MKNLNFINIFLITIIICSLIGILNSSKKISYPNTTSRNVIQISSSYIISSSVSSVLNSVVTTGSSESSKKLTDLEMENIIRMKMIELGLKKWKSMISSQILEWYSLSDCKDFFQNVTFEKINSPLISPYQAWLYYTCKINEKDFVFEAWFQCSADFDKNGELVWDIECNPYNWKTPK